MKHLELINKFREEIAKLVLEVESSVAMSHFDINKICEDVVCGLIKELYGLPELRNLNNEEKQNFPGIDLADDAARVAIQVTADRSLDKIKETLETIVQHNLYEKYDRFIIYVLTKKQSSYSEKAVEKICSGKIRFSVRSDVLDSGDLCTAAASADPFVLKSALDVLLAYMRGAAVGLSEEDFNPPASPLEALGANLVELYFPQSLYIAELLPEVLKGQRGGKVRNQRKAVKDYSRRNELSIPSDFEASGGKLISFHDLEQEHGPFRHLIDEGTVEAFSPSDYYNIDGDHERVFKSLLRFTLQQKLYKQDVLWQHKEGKFIFLPRNPGQLKRSEQWVGQKAATRTVYERKFKSTKRDEVLSTRHFAFSVDFLRAGDGWYVALTPDWFFSFGEEYRRSFYGEKLLKGLKRMEKNRSVFDQFRFLSYWLESIDREDLFSEVASGPTVSFGSPLVLQGARMLDEKLWEPLQASIDEAQQERLGGW